MVPLVIQFSYGQISIENALHSYILKSLKHLVKTVHPIAGHVDVFLAKIVRAPLLLRMA